MGLNITGDPAADKVLDESPFGLLTAMLLDQQVPMETAFAGPAKILERFGSLDPADIAAADPDEFAALCATPPAVHRFPGSMAGRIQALATHVVAEYDGDAARIWVEARDGQDLLRRLQALPGYGKQKAQIFVALVGKRLGAGPTGWAEAAGDYGEAGCHRSVADVDGADSLARVRAFKREKKAAARSGSAGSGLETGQDVTQ